MLVHAEKQDRKQGPSSLVSIIISSLPHPTGADGVDSQGILLQIGSDSHHSKKWLGHPLIVSLSRMQGSFCSVGRAFMRDRGYFLHFGQ